MSDQVITDETVTTVGTPDAQPHARFRAHVGEIGLEGLDDLARLHGRDADRSPRDTRRRRAVALADVVALILAWCFMHVVARPYATLNDDAVLLVALPLWVLLNKLLGLYDRDAVVIHKSTLDEFPTIAQSTALGAGLVYLAGPALVGGEIGRREVVAYWAAAIVLTPLLRVLARTLVRRRTPPERTIIVGSGIVAGMVARKLRAHTEYGAVVVGFVDDGADTSVADVAQLGSLSDFEQICERVDAERAIVAFSDVPTGRLLDVIRISTRRQMKVSVVPRLFEVVGSGVEADQVEGLSLMALRGATRTRSTLALKRTIDVVGAATGLVLFSPVLVVTALAVKLTSPGPALFAQRRVGRQSREFRMLKFRTMEDGADKLKPGLAHLNELAPGPMFKIADDPRVTRVGRFLRRTSLDEIPQLVNVLRGEMSLVGPRPLVPSESAQVLGWHRTRLDLTPGVTGPWQVLGRSAIPFDEMVKLDYLYVADWSLWNDVKLIVRTLGVMARRGGS